ncbi:MAG: GAF domain-containing protein [Gaiellaceae bacterium]
MSGSGSEHSQNSSVEALSSELAQLREQQAATNEVLLAVARSDFELQPIFETVVEQAIRLCKADAGQMFVREGDHFRLACAAGGSEEYRSLIEERQVPLGSGTLVGRVALERRPVMSRDIAHDREYDTEEQRLRQRLGGFRTIVGVPIHSEDQVIAVISLWRRDVNLFEDREIELATTFAAQGEIAIRNASLMQQLDQRTQQLGRSVDQLNGLSKVAEAVSSSLDPEEVLSTIVKHAVELSGTEGGSIFEFDDAAQEFRVRTAYGTSEELLDALRATKVGIRDTLVGRSASAGVSLAVPDIAEAPPDNHLALLSRAGWRSVLAVPLVREDRILGALVVRRRRTGEFSDEIKELLETFASQSALAIHNAHLFQTVREQANQLAEWNRELQSRVEEQVAQIGRMGRLKRFLSPQLAELIVSSGDESFLESHRCEITVVFCDLRGFTAFAETTEPEETMSVLRQYHEALGKLVFRFEGTLERFTGDGLMVFFNDPMPCSDAAIRSVRMGAAMRNDVASLTERWHRSGHDLGFSLGIAQGYATLGRVGFEGRFDYAAIGTVTNLAARLCDVAEAGKILVSQRVHAAVEDLVSSNELTDLQLKGFSRPVTAYEIVGLNGDGAANAPADSGRR